MKVIHTVGPSLFRSRLRWSLALAVLLTVGGGLFWLKPFSASAAPDIGEAVKKKSADLTVYELATNDVAAIQARELSLVLPVSGTLTALQQANVKAKVAAEVRESLVPEGVAVTRGQVIMRLDTADLQARLASVQASEEEARARFDLARKIQENNAALFRQKFISQTAFDTAENSLELAQAGLKSAQSQTSIARRALEDGVVRAPMDGVIAKRFVQPGEKVAPDMPLFSIVNLDQLLFEAQVPTHEIPQIKAGQKVSFTVEGFASRSFSGQVARIAPVAEAGSRTMTVYVSATNTDHALKAGMFAQGGVVLDKTAALPLLPIAALREEGGQKFVHKIEDGMVIQQPVKTNLRNDALGMIAISEGLEDGANVIVARLATVKPGAKVKLPPSVLAATKNALADQTAQAPSINAAMKN